MAAASVFCSALNGPKLLGRMRPFGTPVRVVAPFAPFRPQPFLAASVGRPMVGRGALVVVAAAEKKKGLSSPEQRLVLSEKRRVANKARKSAVGTRMRKVIKLAEELKAKIENVQSEADVAKLEVLISEAYQEIDKAVKRRIFHQNNGSRKKARLARYKRSVLIAAGLYTPAPGMPGSRLPRLPAPQAAMA